MGKKNWGNLKRENRIGPRITQDEGEFRGRGHWVFMDTEKEIEGNSGAGLGNGRVDEHEKGGGYFRA